MRAHRAIRLFAASEGQSRNHTCDLREARRHNSPAHVYAVGVGEHPLSSLGPVLVTQA